MYKRYLSQITVSSIHNGLACWHMLQTSGGTLRDWIGESQDSFLDLDAPSETWARARTWGIYYVDTDCNRDKVLLGLETIAAAF